MQKSFLFHKTKRTFHDLSKEETFIVAKPRPLHPSLRLFCMAQFINVYALAGEFSDGLFVIAIMFLHFRDFLSYHFATRRQSRIWCCFRKKSINKRKLRVKYKIDFLTQGHQLFDYLACLKRRSFALKITFLSGPPYVLVNC